MSPQISLSSTSTNQQLSPLKQNSQYQINSNQKETTYQNKNNPSSNFHWRSCCCQITIAILVVAVAIIFWRVGVAVVGGKQWRGEREREKGLWSPMESEVVVEVGSWGKQGGSDPKYRDWNIKGKMNKKLSNIFLVNQTTRKYSWRYPHEQNESEDFTQQLALNLIKNKNNDQIQKAYQAEYEYAQKKYHIGAIETQLPFCIFIQNDFLIQSETIHLLNSLQALNYTNYHIVYIDDNSADDNSADDNSADDNSAGSENISSSISKTLKNGKFRLNLQIIENKKQFGTYANSIFHIKKYCGREEIVVLLGKGSSFIGRQGLKILNSVFQENRVGFVKAGVLVERSPYDLVSFRKKEPEETVSVLDQQYLVKKAVIRSFRKHLLDKMLQEDEMGEKLVNTRIDENTFKEIDSYTFGFQLNLEKNKQIIGIDLSEYFQVSHRVQPFCEHLHKRLSQKKEQDENQAYLISQQIENCRKRFREKLHFNLENPIRVEKDGLVFKRTIYNEKALQRPFGKGNKFEVNLTSLAGKTKFSRDWISFKKGETEEGSETSYIMTPRNYEAVINAGLINWEQMKIDLEREIPFEVLEFQQDKTIDMAPPLPLEFEILKTKEDSETFMKTTLPSLNNVKNENLLYHLGLQMQVNPQKQEIIEAEYYAVDQMYNISSVTQETPMCIISMEYKLFNRDKGYGLLYKQYFDAVERLNYTNFHIYLVDDFSPDGTAEKLYEYVRNSSLRIKNKITIIHTLRNTGIMANMFYWPQRLCQPGSISLLPDGDDNILGRQSLKAVNAIFENPDIRFMHTRALWWENKDKYWRIDGGTLGEEDQNARQAKFSPIFGIKIFRTELMLATPLFSIVELHFNPKTLIAWPVFQDLSADSVIVFTHLELAGKQGIKFSELFMYTFSGSSGGGVNQCYSQNEWYDMLRTYSKSRMQPLQSLNETGKFRQNERLDYRYRDTLLMTKKLKIMDCTVKQW